MVNGLFGVRPMLAPGQMGGEHREGSPPGRHRFAQCGGQLDVIDDGRDDTRLLQDVVTRAAQGRRVAIGSTCLRGLR